jgi:hypothetical protein
MNNELENAVMGVEAETSLDVSSVPESFARRLNRRGRLRAAPMHVQWQPEPTSTRGVNASKPVEERTQEDLDALAAAEAKRARKRAKRNAGAAKAAETAHVTRMFWDKMAFYADVRNWDLPNG